MTKYYFSLCLLLLVQLAFAQERDYSLFVEGNATTIASLRASTYSENNSNLIVRNEDVWTLGYGGRVGARFLERHHLSLGFEITTIDNNFIYEREGARIGTGYNYKYYHPSIQYSYNLLSHERLALRPMVQVGLGFADRQKSDITKLNYLNASNETFHLQTQAVELRQAIFLYGLGLAFEWEIIDNRLSIGAEAKFLHSPYASVTTSDISLQHSSHPTINTATYGHLMNVHLGAFVRGYF